MAYYPQNATGLNYITYPAGPTVGSATVVAASVSANTKGAYAQITASSGFTCNRVSLQIYGGSSTAGLQYLVDLATGAGGAEVVVIPDILVALDSDTTTSEKGTREWPLAIASATRIAARCACSTGSSNMRAGLALTAAGGVTGVNTFINYGSASGDSGGTAIDPGGSANTKGSYVQISASTSAVIQWLMMMASLGGNTGAIAASWYADLATGAGGAEVVLIPDIGFSVSLDSPNGSIVPKSWSWLTYIAASTRLAVRAACDTTDATDRKMDVVLLTCTAPSESADGGGGGSASVAYVG